MGNGSAGKQRLQVCNKELGAVDLSNMNGDRMAIFRIFVTADYLGHLYEIQDEFDSEDQFAWSDLRSSAKQHWDSSDEFDLNYPEIASNNPLKWLEMFVTIQLYEYDPADPVPSMRGWEQRAFFGKVLDSLGNEIANYSVDFSN